MTKRIFRSICLAVVAVLLASVALILGVLYSYLSQIHQLRTGLAAQGVEQAGRGYLGGLDLDAPEDNQCYQELSPLLRRIAGQQRELALQAAAPGRSRTSWTLSPAACGRARCC